MRSKQLGYVLIALILVGLAGLVVRVISTEPDELVLSGILPVAADVVDRVVIRSGEHETELKRVGDVWRIGSSLVFDLKLNEFWGTVAEIDGAQMISNNPAHHARIGVEAEQGTHVSFFLGPSIQEQFIVGIWTPEVRLCYVRRSGKDEVYAVPCPRSDVFAADPNGWRNPVVLSVPRGDVVSVEYFYPEDEFSLSVVEGDWVVTSATDQHPADLFVVDTILRVLQFIAASDFAGEDETSSLKFDEPDVAVRIVTSPDSVSPTTRLRFIVRDDLTYYVRTPIDSTVYIVDRALADNLLLTKSQLAPGFGG